MPVLRMLDTRRRKTLWAAMALGLTLGLPACGGSSNPASSSTVPTTTVVQQGTFTLVSAPAAQAQGFVVDAARVEFTTSAAGSVQAVVDWTDASNAVAVGIYQGSCTFALYYADNCAQVALQPATNSKPVRLPLANAPAGTYTMVVANAGNSSESGSFQILLTK